jgi:UrcA family protein
MSNRTGIWIKAALLLLAGAWQCDALAAAPAAPSTQDVEQITVRFGDLNIDQPAGAAVLYRRIRHAAERVCGEPRLPGERAVSLDWRRCVAKAVDGAVVAVDRPALTAYHRVHSKPSERVASMALAASSQRSPGE